eukprot:TRINITY_DN8160_c0_g2_i1.p1 TRINITY_DN8160_c0_g2~~TRINITY_DN8160_c0_g2_i1.p1  ORF type:complete len:401 (+),score=136.90 TRINITY_DN8160_c0_g2_i1:66-1205(+)
MAGPAAAEAAAAESDAADPGRDEAAAAAPAAGPAAAGRKRRRVGEQGDAQPQGLELVRGLLGQKGNVGARRAMGAKKALEAAEAAATAPREELWRRLCPRASKSKEVAAAVEFPPAPEQRSRAWAALAARGRLAFDAAAYPLQEAARRYLARAEPRLADPAVPLSQLHRACIPEADRRGYAQCKQQLLESNPGEAELAALHAAYRQLVEGVIAPHVAAAFAEHSEGPLTALRYQREPVLRVMVPSHMPMGVPHIDAEYGHQQGQLNFWMPLSERVYGENSLWLESAPGAKDYAPACLTHGEVLRFYGSRCVHFTKANTTPDTRVSLDWRVVPMACGLWEDDPPESRSQKGRQVFGVGPQQYYVTCRLDPAAGLWRTEEV